MAYIPVKCTQCGADIVLQADNTAVCNHCGTVFIMQNHNAAPVGAINEPPSNPFARRVAGVDLTRQDMQKIDAELRRGKKIPAMRILRKLTGMNLRDAKEFIDDYAKELK